MRLNLRLNPKIIIMGLLLATATHATTIYPLPQTFSDKLVTKVRTCKFNLFCYFRPQLGTTITTINATDLISNTRVLINTTFSDLNRDKVEVGTTTVNSITTLSNLVTVGTLTTGVWQATPIGVAYNGTGTTSPTRFRVMLGDGAYGLAIASTTGTSGQFLTSNGTGAYPSWQTSSVNQTDSYNFTSTYFGIQNLNASSTVANPLILNGVSYSLPQNQNATSSVLTTNGSGVLSWVPGTHLLSAPSSIALPQAATTTILNMTLPAKGLAEGGIIEVWAHATSSLVSSSSAVPHKLSLSLGGNASTTCGYVTNGTGVTAPISATSTFHMLIRAVSSSVQTMQCNVIVNQSASGSVHEQNNASQATNVANDRTDHSAVNGYSNLSNAQPLILEAYSQSGGTWIGSFYGISIEIKNP